MEAKGIRDYKWAAPYHPRCTYGPTMQTDLHTLAFPTSARGQSRSHQRALQPRAPFVPHATICSTGVAQCCPWGAKPTGLSACMASVRVLGLLDVQRQLEGAPLAYACLPCSSPCCRTSAKPVNQPDPSSIRKLKMRSWMCDHGPNCSSKCRTSCLVSTQ